MINFSDYLAAQVDRPGLVGDSARLLSDAGPLATFEDALIFTARHRRVDARTIAALEAAERAFNRTR